jgi:hypothetical protein
MPSQILETTPDQAAGIILATPAALRRLFQAIPEDVMRWQPTLGEWCINDVIGHLILTDLEFHDKITRIMTEWQPLMEGTDVDGLVAAGQYHLRDTFELVDELEADRRETYAPFIRGLPRDQLSRFCVFEDTPQVTGGKFQAGDYVFEWPYHDYLHLNQIGNNIRAYLWPHMSDIMRRALSGDNPPV